MPKPGYTQSPEHKKKRLEQIEGDGNGSYKDGRRSYRRKAGAKNNDGTVVHHKNGDRTNNCASNLERLTDGDRTPGRRTTSAHEKHHGGRHGDSIAIRLAIRNDRKTGGCGKGKVGTGTGGCKAAKGESFLSKAKKKALGVAIGLGVSIPAIAVLNPELRKAYMQTYFPKKRKGNWEPKRDENGFDNDGFDKEGFDKEGFNDYGFDRQGIHRNGTLYNSKGIDADFYDKSGRDTLEIRPPRFPEGYDPSGEKMENFKKIDKRKSKLLDENAHAVAMIRSLRRSVNKGTSPADLKRNREVRKEYASQVASIARKLRDEGKYDSILPTAIALLHHDRKTGGCGRGKVGFGGRCVPAKHALGAVAGVGAAAIVGAHLLRQRQAGQKGEKQSQQNPEPPKLSQREENTARVERRKQMIKKLQDGGETILRSIEFNRELANQKNRDPKDLAWIRAHQKKNAEEIRDMARRLKRIVPSYGINADSILPTAIALLHHDRKTGGCGKGKVGTGTGRCKSAKLSQVTPFSHRTPQEADAARREKLLLQAAKVAVGVGVTGGLATIALKGGKHSNPYHDPPDIAPVKKVEPPASPKPVDSPVLKPPLSSRAETEESLRSLSRIAPPERTPTPPSVSAPVDKGVTAKIETPANDAPESVKKKWLITKLLPAEATVMERSAYVPPVRILSSHVPVGALDNPSHGTQFYGLPKKSGRRRKELAKTSYRTGQLTEGEIRTRSSK